MGSELQGNYTTEYQSRKRKDEYARSHNYKDWKDLWRTLTYAENIDELKLHESRVAGMEKFIKENKKPKGDRVNPEWLDRIEDFSMQAMVLAVSVIRFIIFIGVSTVLAVLLLKLVKWSIGWLNN